MSTGFFTINHVNKDILVRSHSCSFKFLEHESEFDSCALTEEYHDGITAPFVQESFASMGLEYRRHFPIEENGVIMIIGEVKLVRYNKQFIQSNGELNFDRSKSIAVAGNNTYYGLNKIKTLDYIDRSQKKILTKSVQDESNKTSNEISKGV